ncbi:MAG: FHA domain-containing protein [Actinomycetota bacterium]|jgi:pSer/pThr/pTyr-binding forkhead associated (FHA) protein
MTDALLNALKLILLALIYLFFGRVLWAVWSEVRTPVMPAARVGGGTTSRSRAKKSVNKGVPMFVVIEPKQHQGATYTLSSVLAIGRLEDNDIVIDDDSFISSHHARIEIRPEGTWVVDLGSTNGCYVNGQKVAEERSVRKGDRIQVGSTVLEMRS